MQQWQNKTNYKITAIALLTVLINPQFSCKKIPSKTQISGMKTSEMMKAGFVLNFICIGTTGSPFYVSSSCKIEK
jgi:hypothetical protein